MKFTRSSSEMTIRRPSTRRATAMLAAAAAVALTLTACSSGSGASSGGTTTISFTSWDTQEVMQPLITEFEKENPSIDVKFNFVTPSSYISTLQTRLLSNTASDVFILNPEDRNDLVKNKQVADLSNESWVDQLSPANRSAYTIDGKLYGLSTSSWGGGIMFNRSLLEKVGYSEAPTSWADFLDLCAKLKAAGITPFLEPGDGISVSMLALLGIQNQADDGKMDERIFDGTSSFKKEWTPSLKAWGELFTKGLETRSAAGLTGDQVNNEFINGKVAMIGTGSWNLNTVQQGAPKMDVGFFAVPGVEDGTSSWAGAPGPAYAINAKSQHQEQDKKFLDFLASKKGAELFNKSSGSITTTKDFDPVVPKPLEVMVQDVKAGKIYYHTVSWPDYANTLSQKVNSLMQEYMQGSVSATQVAEQMDAALAAAKAGS